MSTTELRAMAQTIIDSVTKEELEHGPAYSVVEERYIGLMEPYELARHILATTADDDEEPPSEDCLRELGGTWDEHQQAFRFVIGSREELFVRPNGQWWAFSHSLYGGRVCGNKRLGNRRDVRAILAALGVGR